MLPPAPALLSNLSAFCHGDDFYAALVFALSSSSAAVFPRTNPPGYNLIANAMIPACRPSVLPSVRLRPITIRLVSVSTHAAHMWSVSQSEIGRRQLRRRRGQAAAVQGKNRRSAPLVLISAATQIRQLRRRHFEAIDRSVDGRGGRTLDTVNLNSQVASC